MTNDHVIRTNKASLMRPLIPQETAHTTRSLVSIVVISCGQLEHTRLSLPCLIRFSRSPFEIKFIDIGSLDGTEHFLDGLTAMASWDVKTLRIEEYGEFPSVFTDLVEQTQGRFIALVSNDTIVSPRWLDQLVTLADSDPRIGLVGPVANYAPPAQFAGRVTYRIISHNRLSTVSGSQSAKVSSELSEFCRFAEQWQQQHRGEWFRTEFLGGFCLLMRREVAKLLTPSPRPQLAFFDEKEFCLKVREAGFTLACCKDLYVHHFGTRVSYSTDQGRV